MIRLAQLTLPSEGEGVVFDPSTGDTFMMNDSGVRILKAFQIGRTRDEIAQMLSDAYQIPEVDAQRDVADFHARLRTYQLV